jgi:hypothetical protein
MIQWSQKQREAILNEAVRGFAGAGWVPSARAETHGIKWHWSREGSDYVIYGRIIAEHGPHLLDYANPDITERFSPDEIERICKAMEKTHE